MPHARVGWWATIWTGGLAALALCFAERRPPPPPRPAERPAPASVIPGAASSWRDRVGIARDRALAWLEGVQRRDGRLGSGEYLPPPVLTAWVLGMVVPIAPGDGPGENLTARATAYVVGAQREDGTFGSGEPVGNLVCLTSLGLVRKSAGRPPSFPDRFWTMEPFPPDALRRYCRTSAPRPPRWSDWDQAVDKATDVFPLYAWAVLVTMPKAPGAGGTPEQEAAVRALAGELLRAQSAEGWWEAEGISSEFPLDRRIVGTCYALKALLLDSSCLERAGAGAAGDDRHGGRLDGEDPLEGVESWGDGKLFGALP